MRRIHEGLDWFKVAALIRNPNRQVRGNSNLFQSTTNLTLASRRPEALRPAGRAGMPNPRV